MTGNRPLLAMRRKGYKPDAVFVRDTDSALAKQCAAEWHAEPSAITGRYFAEIHLDAADVPEQIDWRCVIGLQVVLDGNRGVERLRRLFKAIRAQMPLQLVCIAGDKVGFFDGSVNRG